MALRHVIVHPIQGWGWSDSDGPAPWDYVPAQFSADLEQTTEVWFEKNIDVLRGRVAEPGHPLDCFQVLISSRHEEWDGLTNIHLHSDEGRKMSGFARIDLASFV